jgi:hypothetical protein
LLSDAQARAVAGRNFPAGVGVILNTAVMNLTDSNDARHCLCWVVSINPGYIEFSGPVPTNGVTYTHAHANFAVIAIDASTGAIVMNVEGRDPDLPDLAPLNESPPPSTP